MEGAKNNGSVGSALNVPPDSGGCCTSQTHEIHLEVEGGLYMTSKSLRCATIGATRRKRCW
jgi:hypothetical protein